MDKQEEVAVAVQSILSSKHLMFNRFKSLCLVLRRIPFAGLRSCFATVLTLESESFERGI
jgi:hypothetical protein